LIDQFDKASQKFKSGKATMLFSKVTDKCVELSKIVGNKKAREDKSKTHSKLTSIEHLLKAEIESTIGQSLEKNSDLSVVDIDRPSRASPGKAHDSTQDEYWSDFSDDDYSTEMSEENQAKEVLSSLQRWAYNSNIERNLERKYSPSSVITLDQFKEALHEEGYHCDFIELQALLKRLDIAHDSGIDYKQFFDNLNDKNAAWWTKKLKSNSLEVAAQGKRNGNYRPFCNPAIHEFILANIGVQTKQAINRAGYFSVSELIEEIYYENPSGLSKRQLRKELLSKDIPLTRLDTHILYKTLEDPESQSVKSSDFRRFVDDPEEYVVAKGLNKVGGAKMFSIDESVIDPNDGLKSGSQYDEPLNRLRTHVKTNKCDIAKALKEADTAKIGEINRSEFLKFNKLIKSPLTVLEQKGLFAHITQSTGLKITVPDLTNLLKSSTGPAPGRAPVSPSKKPSSPGKAKMDIATKEKLADLEKSILNKNALIKTMEAEITQMRNQLPSLTLKDDLAALQNQNRELREEAKKAQQEKRSLEKILKENFTTPESGDFILLQKKIELLEQGVYEREKQIKKEKYNSSTYQKYKKENEGLAKQIEEERAYYLSIIQKKNQEIAVFRQELDMLLEEVDHVKRDNIEKEKIFMENKGDLIPR